MPMEEASRAFTTPFELYQFQMMPFGLSGTSATFQWLMDKVLCRLDKFSAAYLDDIVIYSKTWKEHLEYLRQVLQKLDEAGLTAKPRKCQFATKQCSYLGRRFEIQWNRSIN